MKILFNILLIIFVWNVSFSQEEIKKEINKPYAYAKLTNGACVSLSLPNNQNALSISGYGSFGSNHLNNTFINTLAFGGNIDDEMKDDALDKSRLYNRLGGELNYSVNFYNLKDTFLRTSPNLRYYFGFGSFTNYSTQYTNDVFETVFYGNKPFVNEPIFLDGTRVFQSDFKKITFGVFNIKNNWKLGLSVVSGNQHQLLSIREGDLITKDNGNEIVLDADAIIQQSDSNSNGYLSFSSAGFALDFEKTLWNFVTVGADNVGLAFWRRNPATRTINSPVTFDGFTVDNINDLNNLKVEDELDSLIPQRESEAFTSILPAIFTIKKAIDYNKTWQVDFELRAKLLSNYVPYQYVGVMYQPNRYFDLSGGLSYGGYNNFEGRFQASYSNNNFRLGVGTNHLVGLISDENGYGKSAYFSAAFWF